MNHAQHFLPSLQYTSTHFPVIDIVVASAHLAPLLLFPFCTHCCQFLVLSVPSALVRTVVRAICGKVILLTRLLPQVAGHLMPADAAASTSAPLRSPITTHVLDTALGAPAKGLPILLHKCVEGSSHVWSQIAAGVTDADGRIGSLLPASNHIAAGR